MTNYDYPTDQLTPEERETRINAAILELERNPNASRRGVARNHGLPESTLRGRMKKLRINYKSFNKDERRIQTRDHYDALSSSLSPPTYTPNYSTLSNAATTSQNLIYAQYYLQQQLQQQQQLLKQQQLYQQQQQQIQQQQQQQNANSTSVPAPILPPYKAPPLAQMSIIEYHSKIDRNYMQDTETDTKELKPTTINTLPKKLIPIKILNSNLVKYDEDNFNLVMTETTFDIKERQQKIDECIEELTKNPYLQLKDVSMKYRLPQSTIRRNLRDNKVKLVEYALSEEIESRVLSILKKFEFIQDVNFYRTMITQLIEEFIKQDYYSQDSNLNEMLDNERNEEIVMDFLYKYNEFTIGDIKLQDLIV